jgi:hypothetical protein
LESPRGNDDRGGNTHDETTKQHHAADRHGPRLHVVGRHPARRLYVHHTDADREWAYDRKSSIGRLDKGLDEAKAKAWTIVDMKRDWKRVFAFEKE